jgi:hypothetical protein
MLFRTADGKLVEINKYDFKNDKLYYKKLMEIYKCLMIQSPLSKL